MGRREWVSRRQVFTEVIRSMVRIIHVRAMVHGVVATVLGKLSQGSVCLRKAAAQCSKRVAGSNSKRNPCQGMQGSECPRRVSRAQRYFDKELARQCYREYYTTRRPTGRGASAKRECKSVPIPSVDCKTAARSTLSARSKGVSPRGGD